MPWNTCALPSSEHEANSGYDRWKATPSMELSWYLQEWDRFEARSAEIFANSRFYFTTETGANAMSEMKLNTSSKVASYLFRSANLSTEKW